METPLVASAGGASSIDPTSPDTQPVTLRLLSPVGNDLAGRFRLLGLLSAGGQGEVYLAEDLQLRRRVAIKLIHEGTGEVGVKRLQREARAIARLENPHICPIYEVGEHEGLSFLVLKHIEGKTLARRIQEARAEAASLPSGAGVTRQERGRPIFSPSDLCDFFARIAHALACAHTSGIVHRDLKPANLMVTKEDRPMIFDFGLVLDSEGPLLTRSGDVLGTPAYMAPEQIGGRHAAIDGRTDIFSLGVCLFESLTLERPFQGITRSDLHQAIVYREPLDPRALNPDAPRELCAIILKALEKNPARRYQNARDLANDLEACRDGRPVSAKPLSMWTSLCRRARNRPFAAAIILAFIITISLAVGFGTFWLMQLEDIERGRAEEHRRQIETLLADGFLELGDGRLQRAIECLDRALAAGGPDLVAVAGRAIAAMHSNEPEVAIEVLDRLSEEDRRSPGAVRLRIDTFKALGSEDLAEEARSLMLDRDSAVDHFVLGQAALRLGHGGDSSAFRTAVSHFQQAIHLSRSSLPIYYLELVHAATHDEDRETAQEAASVLIRFWGHSAAARLRAGVSNLDSDPRRALAELGQACRLASDPTQALLNIGVAHRILGHHAESIEVLKRALGISPEYPPAHFDLGASLHLAGQTDKAIDHLRRAVELDPSLCQARHVLGLALASAGRKEEARQEFAESSGLAEGPGDLVALSGDAAPTRWPAGRRLGRTPARGLADSAPSEGASACHGYDP